MSKFIVALSAFCVVSGFFLSDCLVEVSALKLEVRSLRKEMSSVDRSGNVLSDSNLDLYWKQQRFNENINRTITVQTTILMDQQREIDELKFRINRVEFRKIPREALIQE